MRRHCVHDTVGIPHALIMLTMSPFEQGGAWGAKHKKEYIFDQNGAKIHDRNKRQHKFNSVPATDWNEQTKAEEWRSAWGDYVNAALEQMVAERIDHRSYKRQGIEQIPTIYLVAAVS